MNLNDSKFFINSVILSYFSVPPPAVICLIDELEWNKRVGKKINNQRNKNRVRLDLFLARNQQSHPLDQRNKNESEMNRHWGQQRVVGR